MKTDSKMEIKEEANEDSSIFLTSNSKVQDNMSLRRFIKGSDGIYIIAYSVRPKLKNDEIFKTWSDIIRSATLKPNPETKK